MYSIWNVKQCCIDNYFLTVYFCRICKNVIPLLAHCDVFLNVTDATCISHSSLLYIKLCITCLLAWQHRSCEIMMPCAAFEMLMLTIVSVSMIESLTEMFSEKHITLLQRVNIYTIWPKVCGHLLAEHLILKSWSLIWSWSSLCCYNSLQSSGKAFH